MKAIFTLLAMLLAMAVFAQENPSNFILGGSMNFFTQKNYYPLGSIRPGQGAYSNSDNDFRATSFSFSPYFGKQVHPKWIVGTALLYSRSTDEQQYFEIYQFPRFYIDTISYRSVATNFGVEVFGRYILNPEKEINFFFQPSIGYYSALNKQTRDETEQPDEKGYFVEIGTSPGIAWNVTERLRLVATIGSIRYVTGKAETENNPEKRSFSSFETNFGLRYVSFGLEFRL